MSNYSSKTVIQCPYSNKFTILMLLLLLKPFVEANTPDIADSTLVNENSIEQQGELASESWHKRVACGSIASNLTKVVVKNPHHPDSTYTKAICEIVVERLDPSIKKLKIHFKQLELYRPTIDGTCMNDRFGVYNDLNVAVTPIICGNNSGKNISIPFVPPHSSLIVSITTSDLDHDRYWVLEIEQE